MENKREDIKDNINKSGINRVDKFDIKRGGIYIETTDDPRGWMLGDKTRRIYEATIAQVGLLTNLLITVSSRWGGDGNGDNVRVKVHNPGEVSRMLVSLNDDVGSSVRYGLHDGSKILELSAEMGQHVCIESITNGNWIRVQIFPGENIAINYSQRIENEPIWVQDVDIAEANSIIKDMIERNSEYINNTGAQYIIGPAKSENPDHVGIYFVDPTSGKGKSR